MKVLSIILTVLLILPVERFFGLATQLYWGAVSLTAFGVNKDQINTLERPFIIYFIVYFFVFCIAVFLNIKKKYLVNIAFSGIAFIIYVVIIFSGFNMNEFQG
jgi:hypothetical protein